MSEARPLGYALRRFPNRADSVTGLADASEAFRDMCEELAEAEEALAALSPGEQAAERRAECIGWIIRLTEEMTEALVRFDASSPGRRR